MNTKYLIIGLLAVTILLILIAVAVVSTSVPENQPATETTSSPTATHKSYAENLVVTFTNKAYPTDINQPNPRLRRYLGKVQNTGEETVTSLTFRMEYLDNQGKPIKEQTIGVGETLKPNFIQEFTFGGLDVPEDWSGKVRYNITDIRFANDRAYQYYPPVSPSTILERSPQEIILSPVF